DAVDVEHEVGPLRVFPGDRHLLGDREVVVASGFPVNQPDGDVLLAHVRPSLHAVAEQAVHLAVGVVESLAAAERRGLTQLEQDLLDDLVAVALALQPVREQGRLDVAVVSAVFPVAEVAVAEGALEERDCPPLRKDLALADSAHALTSRCGGSTKRTRPVRSCCIMPSLIARVLSRRRSSAVISASMSDSSETMATCSS